MCIKSFTCTYKKYWQVSNYEAHLKTHLVAPEIQNDDNNEATIIEPIDVDKLSK